MDILDFKRTRLNYRWDESSKAFKHNFSTDWQLFIAWHEAEAHVDQILQALHDEYSVIFTAKHQWTPEKVSENTARFYRWLPNADRALPQKIGDGRFTSIVVRDPQPRYRFDRTVSGQVMLVNEKVVRSKSRYRALVGGYGVHSSNNLAEFFEQATLLYGPGRLRSVLAGTSPDHERLDHDLYAAHGWKDLTDLFEVLNLSCEYLVLRNFDHLPDQSVEDLDDLDILCQDVGSFVAAANASVSDRLRPYKCVITVAGSKLPVDARYVGDGYLDSQWAREMIRRHTVHKAVVSCPRPDDHFFSLLYHAKLQKYHLKEEYARSLPSLAGAIGLDSFSEDDVRNDSSVANLLSGYMATAGYRFEVPVDIRVERNRTMERLLTPDVRSTSGSARRSFNRLATTVASKMPRRLRSLLPRSLRRRLWQSLAGR